MVLLRAGLWTVAAAAAAAAAAYDEDAAGLATSAPGAEFRGGPALGASGATGATGVEGAEAGDVVRDATGTMDALESMSMTGAATAGAASTGAAFARGATGLTANAELPTPTPPRSFPEVAFPRGSNTVAAQNGTAICGRASSCVECTALVGCGFDSDLLRCVPGTSEGPIHPVSENSETNQFHIDNFWQYGSCSDVSCEEYKAWERAKIERRRAYDARMERAMEALENITDSKSAADFVREAKEKKRLEAEAAQLKAVDIRMETGVKRLREMKRNGSNATAEEKEQLAEEVKDDMMKLEMERARAANAAMQAELAQTAREFESVKKMQRTQKAEDMDTMERAAESIKKTQDDELKKSKQTIVIERIQFVGLSMQKLNEAYDDNMRLLRDFFIKWIGVDNPHDLRLTIEPSPHALDRESLLQVNAKSARRMRGSLMSRVYMKERNQTKGGGSVFAESGIIVAVEVSIQADRKGDIDSVVDLFSKIASNDASSEILIAGMELAGTLCSGVSHVDDVAAAEEAPNECSVRAEPPKIREVTLDTLSSSRSSGSARTNATRVAEAAERGNLTDIGTAINGKDTPDIASAVEAQKMETLLSEETPRQSRPDQSLPGPPFPGAWGTLE
eukprot:g2718.t1